MLKCSVELLLRQLNMEYRHNHHRRQPQKKKKFKVFPVVRVKKKDKGEENVIN